MINGFILEITNRSSEWENVTLFIEGGENPKVEIKVLHSDYTYNSLLLMAKSKGFIGSGLQSEHGFIEKVNIYAPTGINKIEFKSIWDAAEIYIDGVSSFIALEAPPLEKGIFQLMPVPPTRRDRPSPRSRKNLL
jgi:hypothetical protein